MEQKTFADLWSLLRLFAVWKTLLLCIAYFSPGPGYDTSTHLILHQSSTHSSRTARLGDSLISNLVRWDAFYFTKTAERGYLFEQEWAFGWGFTRLLAFVSKVLPASLPSLQAQAIAGVVVAHTAHCLSVIILYALACQLPLIAEPRRRKVGFVAASLHIFSSAGLFLSAPYAESLFSMLNFLGILLHSQISWQQPLEEYRLSSLIRLLGAGICFGLASTVRSNGLLSGLVFVHHLTVLLKSRFNFRTFVSVVTIGLAGILTLLGTLVPQYIAYQEFCTLEGDASARSWCTRRLPSIYTWVQEHYWNVGFLRYWTFSNLPLFLLALPMLVTLVVTGFIASSSKPTTTGRQAPASVAYMRCLALPQIVLATLALTSFHVQVINRLATGYPIWYIVLAETFTPYAQPPEKTNAGTSQNPPTTLSRVKSHLSSPAVQQFIFRGMMMYSIIQGGLYASFLPPA